MDSQGLPPGSKSHGGVGQRVPASGPVRPGWGRQDCSLSLPPVISGILRNPVCPSINMRGLLEQCSNPGTPISIPAQPADWLSHSGLAQTRPQECSGKGREALPSIFRILGSQGHCGSSHGETPSAASCPTSPATTAPVPAQVCIHTCARTDTHTHVRAAS